MQQSSIDEIGDKINQICQGLKDSNGEYLTYPEAIFVSNTFYRSFNRNINQEVMSALKRASSDSSDQRISKAELRNILNNLQNSYGTSQENLGSSRVLPHGTISSQVSLNAPQHKSEYNNSVSVTRHEEPQVRRTSLTTRPAENNTVTYTTNGTGAVGRRRSIRFESNMSTVNGTMHATHTTDNRHVSNNGGNVTVVRTSQYGSGNRLSNYGTSNRVTNYVTRNDTHNGPGVVSEQHIQRAPLYQNNNAESFRNVNTYTHGQGIAQGQSQHGYGSVVGGGENKTLSHNQSFTSQQNYNNVQQSGQHSQNQSVHSETQNQNNQAYQTQTGTQGYHGQVGQQHQSHDNYTQISQPQQMHSISQQNNYSTQQHEQIGQQHQSNITQPHTQQNQTVTGQYNTSHTIQHHQTQPTQQYTSQTTQQYQPHAQYTQQHTQYTNGTTLPHQIGQNQSDTKQRVSATWQNHNYQQSYNGQPSYTTQQHVSHTSQPIQQHETLVSHTSKSGHHLAANTRLNFSVGYNPADYRNATQYSSTPQTFTLNYSDPNVGGNNGSTNNSQIGLSNNGNQNYNRI